MRILSTLLALLFAALFVLTAVVTLFLYDLSRLVSDREAMSQVLGGQLLEDAMLRSTLVEQLRQQTVVGTLPPGIQNAVLSEENLEAVYNSDWAEQQKSALVDAIYEYLETGDEGEMVIPIDTGRLLAALRGDLGYRLITQSLEALPPCTDLLPEFTLDNGRLELPACLPPLVPTSLLADQLYGILVRIIDSNPLGATNAQLQVSLLDLAGAGRAQLLNDLQRLRQIYVWGQQIWLLWLVPLACLLIIALLVVRSFDELALWWGFLLAATGFVSLVIVTGGTTIITAAGESLASRWLLALPSASLLETASDAVIRSLADIWLANVLKQAAAILILGATSMVAGLVLRWMRGPRRSRLS